MGKYKNVDDYIKQQKAEHQVIIQGLREIVHQVLPETKEEMGYGVICYDDKFYIASLPKQVNMGFSIVDMPEENVKRFDGTGKTMRHIKIFSLSDIDRAAISELMNLVISPVMH